MYFCWRGWIILIPRCSKPDLERRKRKLRLLWCQGIDWENFQWSENPSVGGWKTLDLFHTEKDHLHKGINLTLARWISLHLAPLLYLGSLPLGGIWGQDLMATVLIQTTLAACIEEATVNIDAAISSVFSNWANILSLKEHQRMLSSASRVAFDVTGWSSTSIKMTDKWFIQSYAQIFVMAQPSKTPLQWIDPRWMSGTKFI